jgi:hypothetical protein
MASPDAKPFPVSGQPYRLYFVVKSLVTGNPVTGGLTGLSITVAGTPQSTAQISQDGGLFNHTVNIPQEIGTSGYGYLDLTSAEMTASALVIRVTTSNTNAIEWQTVLLATSAQAVSILSAIAGLAFPTVGALAAAVWGIPDGGSVPGRPTSRGPMLDQIYRYLFNGQRVDKLAQTQTLLGDDNLSVLVSGPVSANSQTSFKGKMT